jgi:large subunit ribosomal protein L18e
MKGQKTNPRLIFLINDLKAASRQHGVSLWRDIAKRLEKPRRNYAAVNLSKINRYTKNNDIVIVPGKVLATGEIDHSVIVSALSFSSQAAAKISAAGGKCLELNKLVQEHPEGTGIIILR